jgi:hypothetical protein
LLIGKALSHRLPRDGCLKKPLRESTLAAAVGDSAEIFRNLRAVLVASDRDPQEFGLEVEARARGWRQV